uniref:C-type lectin domain-containing protein n=1 Tax=Haplochromis burtoni TaxID=8153 RepID=A0A3Q2VKK0_HAPBU
RSKVTTERLALLVVSGLLAAAVIGLGVTGEWMRCYRDECRAKRGDLVKIDSREEQTFLNRRLRDVMTEAEDKFWIGLTDSAVEGRWLWVDGSQLNQSEADSLEWWFDAFCSKPHRSICKKAGVREKLKKVCD